MYWNYGNECIDSADYVCAVCGEGESGRIRAVAYVRQDVRFVDITNPLEWLYYISLKQAYILPEVRGSYDGGKESTSEGFGAQQNRVTGMLHTVEYAERMRVENLGFYNVARRRSDLRLVYVTERYLWWAPSLAKIAASKPIEAGLDTENIFKVSVQWASMDFAAAHEIPAGVFDSCARLQALLAQYCAPCAAEPTTGTFDCPPCPPDFGSWATFQPNP